MKRVLHQVRRHGEDLDKCRVWARPGDAILLRGVAVMEAVEGFWKPQPQVRWYVLEADLIEHGLQNRDIREEVVRIDYDGFVELVCEFELCQSW